MDTKEDTDLFCQKSQNETNLLKSSSFLSNNQDIMSSNMNSAPTLNMSNNFIQKSFPNLEEIKNVHPSQRGSNFVNSNNISQNDNMKMNQFYNKPINNVQNNNLMISQSFPNIEDINKINITRGGQNLGNSFNTFQNNNMGNNIQLNNDNNMNMNMQMNNVSQPFQQNVFYIYDLIDHLQNNNK